MGQIVFKELPEEPLPGPSAFRGGHALLEAAARSGAGAGPSASPRQPAGSRQHRIAELYREYGPFVYRRCLRLLKHPDAARDATQEVFVKLVRDIGKLEDRASSLPWLYRVATNHCLNHVRHQKRGARDVLESALQVQAAPASGHAYPQRILVHAILSRFDAATQAIAVGVFVDGMEHDEVAQAVGVSRRTVARKLERFLEKARELIAREGADELAEDRA